MAKTREYMDYLDDNIGIAPAYSEEEYQASETIAGIMREHDVETSVEEFDGRASGDLMRNALVIVMFVTLLLAGILSDAMHVIFLLMSIVASGLLVFTHFVRDVFEELGSTRRSQNVVAVRRARAEEVVRGTRPIVIVAHYDTPRESVMRRGSLAHYLPLLTRVAALCPAVVAVTLLFQILLFLPDTVRMFMWIVGLVASVPALFVAIGSIVSSYGNCTLGSNDNKSSVAALLAMMDKVSPAEDRVTAKDTEKPARPRRRRTDEEPVVVPRTREVVEEVHGVRHGEDVLRSLGILPETCEITYEEPRVTVVEESPAQDDGMDALPENDANEFVDDAYDDEFESEFDEEYDDSYDDADLGGEDDEYADEDGEPSSPGILSRLRGLPTLRREDEPEDEEEFVADDDEQYFEDEYYDDGIDENDADDNYADDNETDDNEPDDELVGEDEPYLDEADEEEDVAAQEDYEDEGEDYDDYVYEEEEAMGSSIGAWFSERISAIRARFASGEKDDDEWIDEDESSDEEEYFDEDDGEDLVEADESELADEDESVDDVYEDEDDEVQEDEPYDDDSFQAEAEDEYSGDYEDEYLEDEFTEEEYLEEEEYSEDEELLEDEEYPEDEEEFVDGPDADLDAYDDEEELATEDAAQFEEEVSDDPDALADLAFDAELEEDYASDFEYDDEYEAAYAEESYAQPYVATIDDRSTYEEQAYEEPAYEETSYEEPVHEENAYEEPDDEVDASDTQQDFEELYDEDVLEDDDAPYDEYEDDVLYDTYDETEEDERDAQPTSGHSIVGRFLGLFRKGGRGAAKQSTEDQTHDTYGDEYGQDEFYLEEGEAEYDGYDEMSEDSVMQAPADDGYESSYGQGSLEDAYEDEYGDEYADEYEDEYLEDYDDEPYMEDLPEAPLPDPNMLHFDREEDDDIVARDDSGLNTISDSYDLYARDVERESRRTKPAAIEDPTWGTSTYQPARPAMNIARRAALYDLPDPSGATIDPLADDFGYEEDVRETRGGFWHDSGNAQADSWKGGAAIRDDLRDEETSMFDGELQDAMLELGDGFLDEHDIWFVATGASASGHSGIKAFLDAHRRDIRGAFLINLECVGAGDLAVYGREGIRNSKKADRRLVRMVLDVARDLHIGVDTANCDWNETDAASAMRARVRSVSIVGLDPDNLPALSQTADDVPENVNPDQVDDVVRIVTEVIRRA